MNDNQNQKNKKTHISRKNNLFFIEVGSQDSSSWQLLKSPKILTDDQFKDLMEKVLDEEWKKLVVNNIDLVTGSDLFEKVVERLKMQFKFSEVSITRYFISEFEFWDDKEKN